MEWLLLVLDPDGRVANYPSHNIAKSLRYVRLCALCATVPDKGHSRQEERRDWLPAWAREGSEAFSTVDGSFPRVIISISYISCV